MIESFSSIVSRLVRDVELADIIYLYKEGKMSRKEFIEHLCRHLKSIDILNCER